MEHNPKIDWKTGKMDWPESKKTPDWIKIRQKSNENHMKKTVTISTAETVKRYTPNWTIIRQKTLENIERLKKTRYVPDWTAIRQKTLENIERIQAKGKRRQDNPEPIKPRWRFSKLRKQETGKGQLEMDDTPVIPKEEDADQEPKITKTDGLMKPPKTSY